MSEPMINAFKMIEKMGGPKESDSRAILEQIKANTAKLDACPGPHDFQPIVEEGKSRFLPDHRCTKCQGEVDLTRAVWYKKGLADAKKT